MGCCSSKKLPPPEPEARAHASRRPAERNPAHGGTTGSQPSSSATSSCAALPADPRDCGRTSSAALSVASRRGRNGAKGDDGALGRAAPSAISSSSQPFGRELPPSGSPSISSLEAAISCLDSVAKAHEDSGATSLVDSPLLPEIQRDALRRAVGLVQEAQRAWRAQSRLEAANDPPSSELRSVLPPTADGGDAPGDAEKHRTAFDLIDEDKDGRVSCIEVVSACMDSGRVRVLLGLPENVQQHDGEHTAFEQVLLRIRARQPDHFTFPEFAAFFAGSNEHSAHDALPTEDDGSTELFGDGSAASLDAGYALQEVVELLSSALFTPMQRELLKVASAQAKLAKRSLNSERNDHRAERQMLASEMAALASRFAHASRSSKRDASHATLNAEKQASPPELEHSEAQNETLRASRPPRASGAPTADVAGAAIPTEARGVRPAAQMKPAKRRHSSRRGSGGSGQWRHAEGSPLPGDLALWGSRQSSTLETHFAMAEAKTEVDTARREAAAAKKEAESALSQLAAAQQEASEAKALLAASRDEEAEARRRLDSLGEELRAAQQEAREAQKEAADAQLVVAALQTELEGVQAALLRLRRERQEVEAEASTRVAQATEAATAAAAESLAKSEQLSELMQRLEAEGAQAHAAAARERGLQSELSRMHDAFKFERDQLALAQAHMQTLQASNNSLQDTQLQNSHLLAAAEADRISAQARIDSLERELAEMYQREATAREREATELEACLAAESRATEMSSRAVELGKLTALLQNQHEVSIVRSSMVPLDKQLQDAHAKIAALEAEISRERASGRASIVQAEAEFSQMDASQLLLRAEADLQSSELRTRELEDRLHEVLTRERQFAEYARNGIFSLTKKSAVDLTSSEGAHEGSAKQYYSPGNSTETGFQETPPMQVAPTTDSGVPYAMFTFEPSTIQAARPPLLPPMESEAADLEAFHTGEEHVSYKLQTPVREAISSQRQAPWIGTPHSDGASFLNDGSGPPTAIFIGAADEPRVDLESDDPLARLEERLARLRAMIFMHEQACWKSAVSRNFLPPKRPLGSVFTHP